MRSLYASLVGIIFVVVLGACSVDEVVEKFVPQALAVLVYGDAESVDETIDGFAGDLVDSVAWDVKVVSLDGQGDVMAIDEETAADMVDKRVWNKVLDGDKFTVATELPIEESGVWFTKSADDALDLAGATFPAAGNYILGNGRTYVDSFLVLPSDMWESLAGEERTVGFLHFHEDENPKRRLNDFPNVETVQLVDLK